MPTKEEYVPQLNDCDRLQINSFDPTLAAKEFIDPLLTGGSVSLDPKKIADWVSKEPGSEPRGGQFGYSLSIGDLLKNGGLPSASEDCYILTEQEMSRIEARGSLAQAIFDEVERTRSMTITPNPAFLRHLDKEITRRFKLRCERYNKSVYMKARRSIGLLSAL